MLNRRLAAIALILFSFTAKAQEDLDENSVRQSIIEQRIEAILETVEEEDEVDVLTLFDELTYYFEHPLDLNRATAEELRSLHLMNDLQIAALLKHIKTYGRLDSIYELQAIAGFSLDLIYTILPFVYVGSGSGWEGLSLKTVLKDGRSDLFIRYQQILEEQEGFSPATDEELAEKPNSRFLGSPVKLYTRYRFTYGNQLSFGITGEKDPGEEFFKGTQKQGFDYYSAHLFLRGKGLIKAIALGDYQAQFGQGLVLWSGLGFGRSPFIANVKRSARGLMPYTSVNEGLFLRGGAVNLAKGKFQLTAFYSHKNLDANLEASPDTLQEEDLINFTSIQYSGFHRTPAELEDKGVLPETHFGGNVSFSGPGWKVGATAMRTELGGNFNRNLQLYNQFEFSSSENSVASIDYNVVKRNLNIFGETAMSESGGIASINGVLIALNPKVSFSALHRYFQRDFHSLLANVFAESTRPANERGLYMGLEAAIRPKWTLTAYLDRFKFDWLRFQSDAPSEGYDALVQLSHKPSKKQEYYVRYRLRNRERNFTSEEELIDFPVPLSQETFRINAGYTVSPSVKLKSRLELTNFLLEGKPEETGFLLAQDIVIRKQNAPWAFSARYALFDTDYNARIYAYENDVLYAFGIPAYFNRGSRVYAMLKYKLRRGVDLWLRWSQWVYTDRDSSGSGLTEIQGNTRTEVKAQIRWRF